MSDDPNARIRTRVRLIAETLNLPAEHLYMDTETSGTVAESNECLRLWFRIRTPEGRRQALETLRALADDKEP